jgi:ABC-type uncharacterized transport system ATPase subunit
MQSVIELVNVTKRYARHTALDDVSLSVPPGVVFALLGENGAGKTTSIRPAKSGSGQNRIQMKSMHRLSTPSQSIAFRGRTRGRATHFRSTNCRSGEPGDCELAW